MYPGHLRFSKIYIHCCDCFISWIQCGRLLLKHASNKITTWKLNLNMNSFFFPPFSSVHWNVWYDIRSARTLQSGAPDNTHLMLWNQTLLNIASEPEGTPRGTQLFYLISFNAGVFFSVLKYVWTGTNMSLNILRIRIKLKHFLKGETKFSWIKNNTSTYVVWYIIIYSSGSVLYLEFWRKAYSLHFF